MPVHISRTPNEQIDQLRGATEGEVNLSKEIYLRHVFSQQFGTEKPEIGENAGSLVFSAKALEHVGLDLMTRYYWNRGVSDSAWRDLIWSAFRLRRSVIASQGAGIRQYADEAIDGVLAHRQPELRFALGELTLDKPLMDPRTVEWTEYVESELLRAFLLVVRKQGARRDITNAIEAVQDLRVLQKELEPVFLAHLADEAAEYSGGDLVARAGLSELVALYNAAKMIEVVGQYLARRRIPQQRSPQGVKDEIDKLVFSAKEVTRGLSPDLSLFVGRLGSACKGLIDASVFSATLPGLSRSLLQGLATRQDRPVLELWYAQREALRQSLLDPTRTAIVVSMPTSAGKTLLAEMAILEAHNDDPSRRIVYLAPTRALVTQVSLVLKRDLSEYLSVRVATPSFELNPVESAILTGDYGVLVTTPEKLDLLIRENHPSVESLSLVVVDEAHSLNDGERGARLELLLANLRRERSGTRYMLLTPFAAKSAEDLAFWLGGEQGAHIVVDWKPNDRVVGVVVPGGKKRSSDKRNFIFKTLDSAHSDCPRGVSIPFALVPAATLSKKSVARQAVLQWANVSKGGVLLLASSRDKAVDRARELAKDLPRGDVRESVDLVCRYLDAEVAGKHPLSELLPHHVAFHHAGLSTEGRYFVERLVEEGTVKVLCATTTLAHGVHFPLSVAVIEDHYRSVRKHGHWRKDLLKPWEFWNIAGRVGRTLEDSLGIVAFAATTDAQVTQIQRYLQKDASEVSSVLLQFLSNVRGRPDIQFNQSFVAGSEGASAFLQYLLHALAVSGREAAFNDLEGILRASFAYQQARKEDPDAADALIRLARSYLTELEAKKGRSLNGYARMVDGTGFSSPSMDLIMAKWLMPEDPEKWTSGAVFPEDGSASDVLRRVVDTLKDIPEIRLGTEEGGEFSVERVARVASMWVNGASILDIADSEYGGDLLKCTHQIYGNISNLLPWGLRAVQRVAFIGRSDKVWEGLDLLPAMIYHGVRSREALAFRMSNVPRVAAEGLAKQMKDDPQTDLADVPGWLDRSTDEQWSRALPPGSPISGHECRALWEVLEGKRTWQELPD